MNAFLLVKSIMMTGLASWLTIACLNNIVDKGTNRFLLKSMLSMHLLEEESSLGTGLQNRALNHNNIENILLWIVIAIQVAISLLLWWASVDLWICEFHLPDFSLERAVFICNIALAGFIGLWLLFMCGGLWFGYWIKMGHVQQVHMMLLAVGFLAIIITNMPN